jgi:transposase
MVLERTSVGLDVHARSIVAGVLDVETGELWSERLPVATEAVLGWVGSLPGPVAVAYEAGPTGFGLARGLQQLGVRCVVVAPSKLERPPGIGSRPTGATLSASPGCCTSGNCPRCGCRPWPRRPPGI